MNGHQHYKLYKSGKFWVTTALATGAMVLGLHAQPASLVHAAQAPLNRSGLVQQLSYSTSYQAQSYTPTSFNKLQQDISWAKWALTSPQATQSQVNWAVTLLHQDGLNLVPVANKSGLIAQLGYAKSYGTSGFDGQLLAKQQQDIATANALLSNQNATQAQVNTLIATLHQDDLNLLDSQQGVATQTMLKTMAQQAASQFAPYAANMRQASVPVVIPGNSNLSEGLYNSLQDSYTNIMSDDNLSDQIANAQPVVQALYYGLYNDAAYNHVLNNSGISQALSNAVKALQVAFPNAAANTTTVNFGSSNASVNQQVQALQAATTSLLAGFQALNNSVMTASVAQQNLQWALNSQPDAYGVTTSPARALLYVSASQQQAYNQAFATAKQVANTNGSSAQTYADALFQYKLAAKAVFFQAGQNLVAGLQQAFGANYLAAYHKLLMSGYVPANDNSANLMNLANVFNPNNGAWLATVAHVFNQADNTLGWTAAVYAASLSAQGAGHTTDPLYATMQNDMQPVAANANGQSTLVGPKTTVTGLKAFTDTLNYVNKFSN